MSRVPHVVTSHERRLVEAVCGLLMVVLLVGFVAVGTGRAAPGRLDAAAPYVPATSPSASPSPPRGVVAARPPAALPKRPVSATRRVDPWARFGFDVSWPQCSAAGPVLPPPVGTMAFVGLSGGRPMTTNRCAASEWRWARTRTMRAGYVNLAAPPAGQDPTAYGTATVRYALRQAAAAGIHVRGLWLDVEVGNAWSRDGAVNVAVIRGAATAAQTVGVQPGVYSSRIDWTILTGDAALTLPEWQAVPDGRQIGAACTEPGFGRRKPDLVQAVYATGGHNIDGDLRCTEDPALLRLLSSAP